MGKRKLPQYGLNEAVILPKHIPADFVRVIRDHVMRAREELDRVQKKLPELHALWVYLKSTGTAIELSDLLESVIDLQNWLDREYLIRAARDKHTASQATVESPTVLGYRRGRHYSPAPCSRASAGPTTPSGGVVPRATPGTTHKSDKPPAVLLCRPKSEDEVLAPLEG